MIDIVLNHASRNSKWFTNFLKGSGQGHDFFKVVKDWNGIAQIERPRSSELFQKDYTKMLWENDAHLTTTGNIIIAEALARKIMEMPRFKKLISEKAIVKNHE